MTDLERRLTDLGRHLDVPAGEGLVRAVTARAASLPATSRRGGRRWWRWLAGVVFVGAGVAASPAVADWLGVDGVAVRREPAPTAPSVPLDRGRPVDLADAAGLAGFTPILPAGLGQPDEVWVDDRPVAPVVWLQWDGGPLLTQLEGALAKEPVIEKFAAEVLVERVEVGPHRALWVAGPHEVALVLGEMPAASERYSAEGTLLVEVGSVTVRIETAEGRDEAIRIARSLPGT
jgi:hypothetical protein